MAPDAQDRQTQSLGTYRKPNWREMVWIGVAIAAVIGLLPETLYDVLVKRHGDAQVFFRSGWAVWSGFPLYQVTDHHGWHFHYMPAFAMVMGPFANAPPGATDLAWAMPYWLSIAVWYVIAAAATILAVELWARALAANSAITVAPGTDSPYWMLRLGPPLALVPYIAEGWVRGQPTALVMLLIMIFLMLLTMGRRSLAALALAAAILIKMFPAVFLLIPFLRRDWRTIGYAVLWTVVLLFVLPALLLGPATTVDLYRALWTERLQGLITDVVDPLVAAELSPWASDVVSIGATLGRAFGARPPADPNLLPAWADAAQWVFDAVFFVALVIAGHRRFWSLRSPQPDAPYAVLIAGALLLAALPAMLPVAQSHYWTQAMPLIAILVAETWRTSRTAKSPAWIVVWSGLAIAAYFTTGTQTPPLIERFFPSTLMMLIPLVVGVVVLWQRGGRGITRPVEAMPLSGQTSAA